MKEWHNRQQWEDPTAKKAIDLADRSRHSRRRHHFAPNRLTEGTIPNAYHRTRIDSLRGLHTSLEQTQKGGRIK